MILREDLGALAGLVFALFGVSLTLITGNGIWDAAGTAMIGVLLVAIAAVRALKTKSRLLGESATKEDVARIREAVPVARVIHLEPDVQRVSTA